MQKLVPDSTATPDQAATTPRAVWSLRLQLLIGVNSTMAILLALALIADYRRELGHHLRHEKAALLAEAESIAAALNSLEPIDRQAIQRLLDSVQSGIDSVEPSHHRLQVDWNDESIESRRAGRFPEEDADFRQLITSRPSGGTAVTWETTALRRPCVPAGGLLCMLRNRLK